MADLLQIRRPNPPPHAPLRILLVVPPFRTTDKLVSQLYPMPLAAVTIGAILRAAGHAVEVKDFLLPAGQTSTPPPAVFAGKHAPPYFHFGMPLDDCLAWLGANIDRFDVVGLHLGQCNLFETGQAIAQCVKVLGRPLIIGGPFASTATEEAMARTGADVVVRGEAEDVVVGAFERAADGWKGIVEGTIVDIAAHPMPDWSLAPPENYPEFGGRKRGVLVISRGCPWTCSFCSVYTIMSRRHRRQSTDRIKAELLNLWRRGISYFCFLDDNLFISRKAVDEILGVIAELRRDEPGFAKARFYIEEGIEVRVAAEPGVIARLAAAGFDNLALGIETMNDQRRQAAEKPYTAEQLKVATANCDAAGVTVKAFYIVGFPGDTLASVCADLVSFGKSGMAARPNNLKLYPGTTVTQAYRAAGLIGDDYDWRLSSFWTPTNSEGLDYATIRRLKTVLGAIGHAADMGVRVFADDLPTAAAALAAKKYTLEIAPGHLRLTGNIFRATPYRHMCELLLLAAGAAGAKSSVGKNEIIAEAQNEPVDSIQWAIVAAINAAAGRAAPKPATPAQGDLFGAA